mgnify:CR=1 FL=1
MQVINLLKMNDWPINKFLRIVFAFQIAILGIVGLDIINIHIPILREIITSIYLLFIPGILILRILKVHNISSIESLLYGVGLSVASLMFIGFFINIVFPVFGIFNPISFFYLIITIFIFTMILCVLSYIRDKMISNPEHIEIKGLLSFKIGFLCIIPFFAIIGTYLMNFYQNNLLLMIMVPIIAFTVILVAFNKISEKEYPFVIFLISISLLFHTSLISQSLWGWDIHHEYYIANIVMQNSFWDLNIPYNTNAMLSIAILAPILSKITDMDLVWVFKILYPFLFSLVPIGLYLVFKKQLNGKIAFLSTFFFMSIFTFFREMNQIARQEIAELFFVLVIMLIVDTSMDKMKRALLMIIFALSIIVSHYGLSYILMLSLIGVYLIIFIDSKSIKKIKNKTKLNHILENRLTSSFVILFIIFALAWYMYASSSSAFDSIVHISDQIIGSISTDFLNPDAAQGAAALSSEASSYLHNIPKYLNLLFQFFILLGIFFTFHKVNRTKFKMEFILFALINLILLVFSILLPYFASALNITRVYHISLFFLAPFAVIGGIKFFEIFSKMLKVPWTEKKTENSLKVISILLFTLLLFYTGFVYQITNDGPTSFSLGNIDYPVTNNQEITSMGWLYQVKNNSLVYADDYRNVLILNFGPVKDIQRDISKINSSYIFLGKFNLETGNILTTEKIKASKKQDYVKYDNLIENRNEFYDNGNTQLYN